MYRSISHVQKSSPFASPVLLKLATRSNDNNGCCSRLDLPYGSSDIIAKRRRYHLEKSSDTCYDNAINVEETPKTPSTLSSLLLRPCHICHRRPTTRAVVDAYADCACCGQRACYVCLRECKSAFCGLTMEETQGYEILRRLNCGFDIPHLKVKPKAVCSYCAFEGLDLDGKEVVRCVVCFENEKLQSNERQISWLPTSGKLMAP